MTRANQKPLTTDDYTLRIYQYGYLAQEQTYGLHTDIHQSIEWLPYTVDIPCFLGAAVLDDAGEDSLRLGDEHQWRWV